MQIIAAKIPERFKRHGKLIVTLLLLVSWSLWYPGYRVVGVRQNR